MVWLVSFVPLQIGYAFTSAYSGVSMFNSYCVAAYNSLLFVPIVFFFVDKDAPEEYVLAHPSYYAVSR